MTGKMIKAPLIFIGIALSYAVLPKSFAAVSYRSITVSGSSVPGVGAGAIFNNFVAPVIDNSGQVAFRGQLEGPEILDSNNAGIWFAQDSTITLIARKGAAAPDMPTDIVFSDINLPVLNHNGQIIFPAYFDGPGIGNSRPGIWMDNNGTIKLVAAASGNAPGAGPDYEFAYFGAPVLNNSGHIALSATLLKTGTQTFGNGIWQDIGNDLELVALAGNQVPNLPDGVIFQSLGNPTINPVGQTVFFAKISGPGAGGGDNHTIWRGDAGLPELIARQGDPAPGYISEVLLGNLESAFTRPVINNTGQIAFSAFLTGNDVIFNNNTSIMFYDGNNTNIVAREGDTPPGINSGTFFGDLQASQPILNTNGDIVFFANLTETGFGDRNHNSIWRYSDGGLSLLVSSDDPVPGTLPDTIFQLFSGLPTFNSLGQTAFKARLTGPGITTSNDEGLWVVNQNGEIITIAREGDLFDINDDPQVQNLKVIKSINIRSGSGGEDGLENSFNDIGQIGFHLIFDDDSEGIFIGSIESALLAGDFNSDGFVGIDDLTIVLAHWNQNVTPGDLSSGDLTGEGFVGIDDLNPILTNWNNGTPPTIILTIPEPGTINLIFVSLILFTKRQNNI